jgi:hypothetical protein
MNFSGRNGSNSVSKNVVKSPVVKQDWQLARRELLKGLGVGAACLPLLSATKSYAQAAAGPRRLAIFQMSEGLRMAGWKPNAGSLMSGPLPPTTAAFEPFKADTMFLHGMNNPGGGGGHGSYGCVYYGLGGTGGGQYKEPTGKTVDQVVAGALGAGSNGRPSMHLHVQLERAPRSTTSPGGSRCFWTGQGQPINPQGDPNAVYGEIFAGSNTNVMADPAAIKRIQTQRKSILDYIGGSLTDFQSRLGKEDKDSIGAHLQSIRELEGQLTAQPAGADGKCGGMPGPIPIDDGASYPLILKAHMSLIVAAFKCGVTKVATLQTGDSSGNNINFAFVDGIPAKSKNNYKSPFRNWHDLGHNPVMDGTDHKRIVDKWFMDRWAEFVTQLKAIPEGGGTVLDNTLLLIGNHVEDGGSHNSNALPWMLVGKGGSNRLNLGNMISGGGSKVANVMAGMCTALGIDQHPYGAALNGMLKA